MNSAQDLIGRKLQDKFVITDVLGEGAMGIVYRGFDDATLDEVAIKVLQPSLAVHDEVVQRFQREAAAARRVDHEGTVRVLGRGCEGGMHFLVMELLHGRSLAAVLAETRRVPEPRAARLVIQLCGALQVAHDRGVVHRDIKPDNIMVTEGADGVGERVKLLDFGIAKRLVASVEDSFNSGCETRHGALIGTPEYMAPEQCMGRDVDQRTDIYACGVLLYRMVTGEVPFDGTNAHPFELCQRHIGEDPRPPREICPWIRPEMEAIILRALSKAPDQRQQSAAELASELGRILEAAVEVECEPTERLSVHDVVLPGQAAALALDLAATVPVDTQPPAAPARLVLSPAPQPSPAAPAGASAPLPLLCLDETLPVDSVPVLIPLPPSYVSVPPAIVVGHGVAHPEPAASGDRPTPLPATRRPRRGFASVQTYLPTVALAAVIGAGLGSLFMAIAPLLQR